MLSLSCPNRARSEPRSFGWCFAGLCFALGCTEPRFLEGDAACDHVPCEVDAEAGAPDGSEDVAPAENQPEWQKLLMGRYAVRAFSFGSDGLVGVRTDE